MTVQSREEGGDKAACRWLRNAVNGVAAMLVRYLRNGRKCEEGKRSDFDSAYSSSGCQPFESLFPNAAQRLGKLSAMAIIRRPLGCFLRTGRKYGKNKTW